MPHSRLVTGEMFPPDELQALLAGPRHNMLLYPADTPPALPDLPLSRTQRDPAQLRLVVLDGTWRKSRKMLHLNPLLQQLPRLPLRHLPPSRYLIRQAHRPDQLSTLEATCAALALLEGGSDRYLPLLAAFEGFVAQQIAYQLRE